MDHSDLVEELAVIEKLTPAERISIARQRRAFQLLKWREREKTAENISNNIVDLYERKIKVTFTPSITLLEATARNDADEVRRLLASGADPNSHNEDGLTPLHQCAIDNNVEMLQLLLDNGAYINALDTELWTPLHAAACCGHPDVVRHLIDNGAMLLAVNADGNMPYDICEDDFTLDLIESEMASRGITQEDIDVERMQPERRMLEDLQSLYDRGESLEFHDENGATPLHIACANGFYSCVQFLLECGCSTNVVDDDGWQPIHAAACWSQADIIESLVAYGVDINVRTSAGETPMDLCEDEAVRALIMSLEVEFHRQKLLSFTRDSKRFSKRRKPTSKFESPPSAVMPTSTENHVTATKGAIRRLSIRDKAGVTLARLEAMREAAVMRSFSFDDNNGTLGKKEAPKELPSERPSNHLEHSETNGITFDVHENNGLENGEVVECSTLTVKLSATNAVYSMSNDSFQSIGSIPIVANGNSETIDTNRKCSMETQIRPLSDDDKPKSNGRNEFEITPKINSSTLGSTSTTRKGRRPAPPPPPDSPTSSPSQIRNGQLPSHSNQNSIDSTNRGNEVSEIYVPYQPPINMSSQETNYSRHPMTLTDLKKHRVEERKFINQYPESSGPSAFTMVSNDGVKAKYRAPPDTFVGDSSPMSRSPKLSRRCCSIT